MQQTKPGSAQVKTGLKQVPFTVHAPGAHQVIVTGDFTGWTPEGLSLRKSAAGDWKTILALLPGEYQYRLIIDGQWCDDPQATHQIPNAYGSQNCVLRVPSEK